MYGPNTRSPATQLTWRTLLTALSLSVLATSCTTSETGNAVATATTTTGAADAGTTAAADHHEHASAPTQYDADLSEATRTVTVEVVGGAPVGGYQRVEIDLGSVVALRVTADTSDELHVHGYDILREVSDGHPVHFAFAAEIPGVFEVELHGSGRLLVLLEIS